MSRSHRVVLRGLSFCHDGAEHPLFDALDLAFEGRCLGLVGPNGCGKTTLLELLVGLRQPQQGSVEAPPHVVFCAQRTDVPPAALDAFREDDSAAAWRLRAKLAVAGFATRDWQALSHGERKRLQLAVALWQRPDVLALDEPTNHLDEETVAIIERALADSRALILLVSHDRALLDALCDACVWFGDGPPRRIDGGYTTGRSVLDEARSAALHARDAARAERDRLARDVRRRRDTAAASERRLSKRGLEAKDADARGRIDLARVTGKAQAAGRRLGAAASRAEQATKRAQALHVDKRHEGALQLSASVARRRVLLVREAGPLSIAPERALALPRLEIGRSDRIAITGPNGAGKSRLLAALLADAGGPGAGLPGSGLPGSGLPGPVLSVPQEYTAAEGRALLDDVRALDATTLGRVMQRIALLGSQPAALLASARPSPGEVRKLALASGLERAPVLVALDEPTNHLDLASVEALQAALAELPCALLLVSHDRAFREQLTTIRWELADDALHIT